MTPQINLQLRLLPESRESTAISEVFSYHKYQESLRQILINFMCFEIHFFKDVHY